VRFSADERERLDAPIRKGKNPGDGADNVEGRCPGRRVKDGAPAGIIKALATSLSMVYGCPSSWCRKQREMPAVPAIYFGCLRTKVV